MKRMLWMPLYALLACVALTSLPICPAIADHGGNNKPVETRVRIALTGPAITSVLPQGHADFRTKGTQRQLNVEVEHVLLPAGTILTVHVKGVAVGTITLVANAGELELNTDNHAVVPAIKAGDVVTVTMGANVIVSGTF